MKKRVKDAFRFLTLKVFFAFVYKMWSQKSVKKGKVVFVETRFSEISNSFTLLYDKLVSMPDKVVSVSYLRVGSVSTVTYVKNCLKMLLNIADAQTIMVNDANHVLGCLNIRKETKLIQTWHACGAFKRFGFSTERFGASKTEMAKYPYYNKKQYVTLSSPDIAWAYEEAMGMDGEKERLLPIGVSRSDIYFDTDFKKSAYESLYQCFGAAKNKKVILYAPTFRGSDGKPVMPDKLNIGQMYEKFHETHVLLIKHHPFIKESHEIALEYQSFAKQITDEMTIEQLLTVSDICISDYSSLVFEYSLLNRPMLFYAYDLEDYEDERGFYYPLLEFLPGPVVRTMEELIEKLLLFEKSDAKAEEGQAFIEEYEQRLSAFRHKFMASCDGKATQRILEFIEE